MATDFFIKKEDLLPEIFATLKAPDDAGVQQVVPLTSCTVRFIMKNKADGTKQVDAPATLVDAANGIVKYSWIEGDTAIAGTFRAEWEVQFPDTRLETFPNSTYLEVKVVDDLGGIRG